MRRVLLGRMWPTVAANVQWSVCVCLLDLYSHELYYNSRINQDAIWGVDSDKLKEPRITAVVFHYRP